MSMNTLPLPEELIEQILLSLDVREILRVSTVSTALREITSLASVQYLIALDAYDYTENYHLATSISASEKLSRLRAIQERWKAPSIDARTVASHDLLPAASLEWEFASGVFAWLSTRAGWAEVSVFRLQETGNPPTEQKHTFDVYVQTMALCPAQDLLVLCVLSDNGDPYIDFHCKSLHTGTAHPDVRQGSVRLAGLNCLQVCVREEYLGCLSGHGNIPQMSEIIVANWKTGETQFRIRPAEDQTLWSFCFASSSCLLVGSSRDRNSNHRNPQPLQNTSSIDVYSLSDWYAGAHHRRAALWISSYDLPPVKPTMNSSMVFLFIDGSSKQAIPHSNLTSPNTGVLCVEIAPRRQNRASTEHILFTPLSNFLRDAYEGQGNGVSTFRWKEWGPSSTRLFRRREATYQGTHLHGHRVVQSDSVLDFNQRAISRDLALGRAEGVVLSPSVIRKGHTWLEDIETSLPYRHSLFPRVLPFHMMFAYDEQIVATSMAAADGSVEDLNENIKSIHVIQL